MATISDKERLARVFGWETNEIGSWYRMEKGDANPRYYYEYPCPLPPDYWNDSTLFKEMLVWLLEHDVYMEWVPGDNLYTHTERGTVNAIESYRLGDPQHAVAYAVLEAEG